MDETELEAWVRRSCQDQGVPLKVTDPSVIRRVAALLGTYPGAVSKNDELRALREARYPARTAAEKPADDQEQKLCGHRSVSGRTCTRPEGHAAKSHRYG